MTYHSSTAMSLFSLLALSSTPNSMMPGVMSLSANDFYVQGLEEIEPAFNTFQGDMYAGLLSINYNGNHTNDTIDTNNNDNNDNNDEKDEGSLMFWYFQPNRPTIDDTIVVWFNGGPGCSSFHAGMFLEMGPVTTPLQPAGSFGQPYNDKYGQNEYAWTNASAVVYVEQPVGVGFSIGNHMPMNEEDVARDFYGFWLNFVKVFGLQKRRIYMFAESYGGMYLPGMAHYIYQQNNQAVNPHVNLQGIALGNGWADVLDQGGMVIDYAWWHGMIDSVTRDGLNREWQHCKERSNWEPNPFHTFTTPDECGIVNAVLQAAGGSLLDSRSTNMYDVTTFDTYKLLNEHGNTNERFFNNPEVRKKLHVPDDDDKPWMGCIPGAGRRRRHHLQEDDSDDSDTLPGKILLKDDVPLNMAPYLAELLDETDMRVLVYNGDRDLSTCAQGSELMLNGMDWNGARDWLDPHSYTRSLWMVDEYPAGWVKTVQNLDFLVVYNSGHLVPYNVPVQALDLVTRFISNTEFGDVLIPVVFDPSVLDDESAWKASAATPDSSSFFWDRIVPVLSGFLLGAVLVFFCLKRAGGGGVANHHQYESIQNVPGVKS